MLVLSCFLLLSPSPVASYGMLPFPSQPNLENLTFVCCVSLDSVRLTGSVNHHIYSHVHILTVFSMFLNILLDIGSSYNLLNY